MKQDPNMEEGRQAWNPSLAKEWLALNCYWEREGFILFLFKCFYNEVYKNNGVTPDISTTLQGGIHFQ